MNINTFLNFLAVSLSLLSLFNTFIRDEVTALAKIDSFFIIELEFSVIFVVALKVVIFVDRTQVLPVLYYFVLQFKV